MRKNLISFDFIMISFGISPVNLYFRVMEGSIYIHVPFCKSRCVYCGFYSSTLLTYRQAYVDAVCREFDLRRDYLSTGSPVRTLYLGGGTPSQLTFAQIEQLFHHIYNNVDGCEEVTMECNPDDVTSDFCEHLSRWPVNRMSMGIQTFDDRRLKFLHRRHSASQAEEALHLLRQSGISNVSIDLMFGFPGQTIDEWASDIRHALTLHPEHLSAYSLMYEEGTPLYGMRERGEIDEISEEVSREMYDILCDQLTAAGYEHYEISNFALPGYRSHHNSGYWHGTPYLGLGAAAHSYDGQSRQWNVSDVKSYIEHIGRGIIPCEREELDEDTRYNDLIVTALRTREGIDMQQLEDTLGTFYLHYLEESTKQNVALGLLAVEGGRIHLTRSGLYVSDMVMADAIIAR